MDIMASIAETLIDLHAQLTKKYDYQTDDQFRDMFFRMTDEESRQLIRLCEADLSPGAMVLIGLCHRWEKGTQRDPAQAVTWFKRSADLGNHMAMQEHGDFCSQVDDTLGLPWYLRSAELGNPRAMNALGRWYKGNGRDDRQAYEWFKRSAEHGNPMSMIDLGWCYKQGRGVGKDITLALTWFERAFDTDPDDPWDSRGEIEQLLREMDDPHAYVRYYCRMYESCSCDPTDRCFHEDNILAGAVDGTTIKSYRLVGSVKDLLRDSTLKWYHLEEQVKALTAKIEALGAENETLRTELAYQPGGTGYREAMSDFVTKATCRIIDTVGPGGLVEDPLPTDEVPLLPDG